MSNRRFDPLIIKQTKLRHLVVASYFALVVLIGYWGWSQAAVTEQGQPGQTLLATVIWLIPLLLPAIGLIKGWQRAYTWAGLIMVLYLGHGLSLILEPETRRLALTETVLSLIIMIGSAYYLKTSRQIEAREQDTAA